MWHRKIIVLDCIAIAVIVLALAYRVNQNVPDLGNKIESYIHIKSLIPDPDFFDWGSFDKSAKEPSSQSSSKGAVKTVSSPITARAYLVGDVMTNEIYLQKNKSAVLPVASMSKLITAFAALDSMPASTIIEITPAETAVASDSSRISAGESFSISELMYPLLLSSSNVAAEALASSSDRIKFLTLMSSYAWEVGMPSTFFADPSGLSPRNLSTAEDFFALAKYLYKSRPDILAVTRTPEAKTATTSEHGAHDFINIHPFVRSPDFLGGKTGHTTEAKDTMLTIMRVANRPIAIIVLASDNRKKDTDYLLASIKKILGQ